MRQMMNDSSQDEERVEDCAFIEGDFTH